MMSDSYNEGEHIKEVYARYGLALYFAQVLEHGLVNAMLVLDLIPTRSRLACSKSEWACKVDTFMDRHFEKTMGRMMGSLRAITSVPNDLETTLNIALQKRNWLAHSFFIEKAEEFMSPSGRDQMLLEINESKECFEVADKCLEDLIRPVRLGAGLTDELLAKELKQMMDRSYRSTYS